MFFFSIFFLFTGYVYSQLNYSGFVGQLESKMGISAQNIIQKSSISRYDIAMLLNVTECQNCIHPPLWIENRYNQNFRENFLQLPGKDFNDIYWKDANFSNSNYFYCVAYVGDNNYMRGYPEGLSSICSGLFCGSRDITNGEFIQVITNILSQYIYFKYSANRYDIKRWSDNIKPGTSEDIYFLQEDRVLVEEQIDKCGSVECLINNSSAFKTYIKYCMYNIDKCNMYNYGNIRQAIWPIAEINILQKENILKDIYIDTNNIHGLIDGKTVIQILFELNKIIGCDFDDDYDCDGIYNHLDNCPNHYNPSQKDTDGDMVGDVCDDDIDGDGVLNPIGIVNDLGRINISVAKPDMDNCITTQNPDQNITKSKFIGDACEILSDQLGLYISASEPLGDTPITMKFDAITKGTVNYVEWNFGDGIFIKGKSINHTFEKPGIYNVSAKAFGPHNEARANITVIIGEGEKEQKAMQINMSRISGTKSTEIEISSTTAGDIDHIQWEFSDGTLIDKKPNESFKKVFNSEQSYWVRAKAWKNDKLVAVGVSNIGIGNNYGSKIETNRLIPSLGQTINIKTINNIDANSISFVVRDFGDGNKETNLSLENKYVYKLAGNKIITQTINMKDGKQIVNMLTIYIKDPILSKSYALMLTPKDLWIFRGQSTSFNIYPIGDKINNMLLLSYQHTEGLIHRNYSVDNWPITTTDYSYNQNKLEIIKSTLNINKCQTLETQATIVVQGLDVCLESLLRGDLGSFKCDMDGDGIPDLCDNDIDGDGIENLVGIITHENDDCTIDANNIDFSVFKKHFNNVCTLDNCPFSKNNDQIDLDLDGIGDLCGEQIKTIFDKYNNIYGRDFLNTNDRDGDGIPDDVDLCPDIPETYNGIEDLDGCPEIGIELSCPKHGALLSLQIGYIAGPYCGDGKLSPGETCDTCPLDVGICSDKCGNGILDIGEECDLGDKNGLGLCTNFCTFFEKSGPTCGEGYTLCSDGICRFSCIKNICGNGILEIGEQCDDGNVFRFDGCDHMCRREFYQGPICPESTTLCSDGVCRSKCEDNKCGNGILEVGEQCDDGNLINGDGCNNRCSIEYIMGPQCPQGTNLCLDGMCRINCNYSICGNGILEVGEQCDDGNLVNGDGCNSSCVIESGIGDKPKCPIGYNLCDDGYCRTNCLEIKDKIECGEGFTLCQDGTCSIDCNITDGGFPTCNNNGACESGEGCACSDCNNINSSCQSNLMCSTEDKACCNYVSDNICNINCINVDPDCIISLPKCPVGYNLCDDGYCRVSCITPICGNGKLEFGEQCDDGNLINGDGCNNLCVLESLEGPLCKEGMTLCENQTCSFDCEINGLQNPFCNEDKICQPGEGCACSDCNNSNLSCQEGLFCSIQDNACCNYVSDNICNPNCINVDPDCILSGPICPEGYNLCSDGTCNINCNVKLCGNGILEFGEQCDDGNLINGDGCNSSCFMESLPGMFCPEGTTLCADNTCSLDCSVLGSGTPICNNNGLCESGEGCSCIDCQNNNINCQSNLMCSIQDNACCNYISDGICNKNCLNVDPDCILLGNKCPENYDRCLDGTCRISCDRPICGNLIVDIGEQCDDGNLVNGDGCNKFCILESLAGPLCNEGFTLCTNGTCSIDCSITDGGFPTCNNNGVCELGEGCSCNDCQDNNINCQSNLMCSTQDDACCNYISDNICNINCINVDPDCSYGDLYCENCEIEPDTLISYNCGNPLECEFTDGCNCPECDYNIIGFDYNTIINIPCLNPFACSVEYGICCDVLGDGFCNINCLNVDPDCKEIEDNLSNCGNPDICELTDGCNCPECDGKQASCYYGYACSTDYLMCCDIIGNGVCFEGCSGVDPDCNYTNPFCEEGYFLCDDGLCRKSCLEKEDTTQCGEGFTLCTDGTCSIDCNITDGGFPTCNNNGVCESGEGCACSDCENNNINCQSNLMCSIEDEACCNYVSDNICNINCINVDPDCIEILPTCDLGYNLCDDGWCRLSCEEIDCESPEILCPDGYCRLSCELDESICDCTSEICDGQQSFCYDGFSCSFDYGVCCDMVGDGICFEGCRGVDPDCVDTVDICGDPNICEETDGCGCVECDGQQASCGESLACSTEYGVCCDKVGDGYCNPDCLSVDPDCKDTTDMCGDPNICEETDGCGCIECDGQQASCNDGFMCSINDGLCCDRIGDGKCFLPCNSVDPDCITDCGNGQADPGEDCLNCPIDIGVCSECGNGQLDPGENCLTCPADAGICVTSDECTDVICIEPCIQCPCQYIDFVGNIAHGDKIRAFLWSTTKDSLYNYSKIRSIY